MTSRTKSGWLFVGAVAATWILAARPLSAQTVSGPNSGSLTLTGGVDVPSIYYFRGFRQEREPKATVWPFIDLGATLHSGDGLFKRVGVNVGLWNSLQTGSSGLKGPSKRLHYEEDFYTTLALGFGSGLGIATTYTAYTSPNNIFNTVKEVSLKVSRSDRFNPYVLVAAELSDKGQADGGSAKGTYVELGVSPAFTVMADKLTVSAPFRAGLSAKDYYEGPSGDEPFGFLDVGGLLTMSLGLPDRFGSWNVHGGANVLVLGDAAEAANIDKDGNIKGQKVIAILGIGVTY